jgi:hypothetical protein
MLICAFACVEGEGGRSVVGLCWKNDDDSIRIIAMMRNKTI